MKKHLAGGSLQSWPPHLHLPRDLRYTQVGEAFVSLERELKKTILMEERETLRRKLDALDTCR